MLPYPQKFASFTFTFYCSGECNIPKCTPNQFLTEPSKIRCLMKQMHLGVMFLARLSCLSPFEILFTLGMVVRWFLTTSHFLSVKKSGTGKTNFGWLLEKLLFELSKAFSTNEKSLRNSVVENPARPARLGRIQQHPATVFCRMFSTWVSIIILLIPNLIPKALWTCVFPALTCCASVGWGYFQMAVFFGESCGDKYPAPKMVFRCLDLEWFKNADDFLQKMR